MSRFMIFGNKQHGKDTACEYLYQKYGLKYESSSFFACKLFLFEQMKEEFGYDSIEQCFADRHNHRKYWYEELRKYNDGDRARLGRAIYANASVYCGIRDKEEFDALKQAGLVDLSIWIDASARMPLESAESIKVTRDDADIIIENNGSLEEFYTKLSNLFDTLGYKPYQGVESRKE